MKYKINRFEVLNESINENESSNQLAAKLGFTKVKECEIL